MKFAVRIVPHDNVINMRDNIIELLNKEGNKGEDYR